MSTPRPFYKQYAWDAMQCYGVPLQLDMVVEEASELALVIQHFKRGRKGRDAVIEEIADVEIMIEQLREVLLISGKELKEHRDRKLFRLQVHLACALEREVDGT